MALTDGENGMVMPVAPMYGGGGNGWNSGFGGDWGWIILLLLFAGGGWGFGGGFGGGFGNMMLGYDFPWLMNGQQNIMSNTNNGFRDQMINDNITSVRDGIAGLSTQLCGCCGDMQMALANGFAGVEQGANTRQIANMQQSFANQTAMMQGFNNLQAQQAECCCENRLATCQTQNIIQNEGNQTRFADANNTRDIVQTISSGNQAILDKLCQLELDGVKQNYENRIAGMQNVIDGLSAQVNAADRRVAMGEEVDALYNRLSNCPVPSTPVYGRTPIFTCNQNQGCGCGCGSF